MSWLLKLTNVTINQETENHIDRQALVKNEISALQSVLNSYGSSKSRRAERNRLQNEFNRRVITRSLFQRSMLNLSEVEENIVNLREKISEKKTELKLSTQSIAYLEQLKSQLTTDKDKLGLYGGKAEFIPIANQVIEVQQVRASGKADIEEFKVTRKTLDNSLSVLKNSINELEKTPMIRALDEPVNVLFVPYDNLDAYVKGEPQSAAKSSPHIHFLANQSVASS